MAHLLRAVQRFGTAARLPVRAAITYFSVLALVPILMLAFAILGFVLTVLRPDLHRCSVVDAVTGALGQTDRRHAGEDHRA